MQQNKQTGKRTKEKSQETDINSETLLFIHTHESHEKTKVGAYMYGKEV